MRPSGNPELSHRLQSGGKVQRRAIGHISYTLECAGWNMTAAAKALGISVRTLQLWVKRYPLLTERRYKRERDAAMQTVAESAKPIILDLDEQ